MKLRMRTSDRLLLKIRVNEVYKSCIYWCDGLKFEKENCLC